MIEQCFDDDEDAAAQALELQADMKEQAIEERYAEDRPAAVHAMLGSNFFRNLERGQAHISRETDCALRRFHEEKGRAPAAEAAGIGPDDSAEDG